MAKVISGNIVPPQPGNVIAQNQQFTVQNQQFRVQNQQFTMPQPPVVMNAPAPVVQMIPSTPVMDRIGRHLLDNSMRKPAFADCWAIGSRDSLKVIESYSMPGGDVVIGIASDGEIEYNLIPRDYSYNRGLSDILGKTIDGIREDYRKCGGTMDRQSVMISAKDRICKSWNENMDVNWSMNSLCEAAYRYVLGLGIFEILLSDERIEDIYVDAPCDRSRVHITMNRVEGFNTHIRCRTNLILEQREVKNLISRLKKDTGLPYCESSPVLETDMLDGAARVTVVGYPLSPNGDSIAIRKHSTSPWTLTKLIANGTINPETAGLLSFLVENRSTIIVCGARGAGKSSLLTALLFEFPLSQRILTIEDTMELPAKSMKDLGYKVQSMLIDDRISGDAASRAQDALRVSLRLGESAIVLGEVRGSEVSTLYDSMRTGRAGSSILGTMHGDCAKTVFDRVVHTMGLQPEEFQATDYLVTMGTVRERGTQNENRQMTEFVCTTDVPGRFMDMTNRNNLGKAGSIKRLLASSSMTISDIREEISVRAEMRKILADMGSKDQRFYGPEWIIAANDHLSKQLSSGEKDSAKIVSGFRDKVLAAMDRA